MCLSYFHKAILKHHDKKKKKKKKAAWRERSFSQLSIVVQHEDESMKDLAA